LQSSPVFRCLIALALVGVLDSCDSSSSTTGPGSSAPQTPSGPPTLRLDDTTTWIPVSQESDTGWAQFQATKGLTYRWSVVIPGGTPSMVHLGAVQGTDGRSAPGKDVIHKDSVWIWSCDSTQTVRFPVVALDSFGKVGLHGRAEIEGIPMDAWEPEFGPASAHLLPWDSSVTRTLTKGDTDWFRLPRSDSLSYSVRIVGGKGARLDFVGSNGTILQTGRKLGDSAGGKVLRADLRAGQDTSVWIRVIADTSRGYYTTSVGKGALLPWDPWERDGALGSSYLSEDTLVVGQGPIHRVLGSKDIDINGVRVDSGSSYVVRAKAAFPLQLTILTGSNYGYIQDGLPGTVADGLIRFQATATGVYRIEVVSDNQNDSGAYTFEFQTDSLSIAQQGNSPSPSKALDLQGQSWTQGDLHTGSADWYGVPVVAGKRYVVNVDADATVRLLTGWASDTSKHILNSFTDITATTDSFTFVADSSSKAVIAVQTTKPQGAHYRIRLHEYQASLDAPSPYATAAKGKIISIDSGATDTVHLSLGGATFLRIHPDSGKTYDIYFWGPSAVRSEQDDANGWPVSDYTQLISTIGNPPSNSVVQVQAKTSADIFVKIYGPDWLPSYATYGTVRYQIFPDHW
jgi:hypothetical protein